MNKCTSGLTSRERIQLVLTNQIEDECLTEDDLIVFQHMVMDAIAKKKMGVHEPPAKNSNNYIH
jgi:hypothetical protein